ncbi:hypothetical protein SeLEV6574_g07102 [Synchytrium endobioticum]|uniref:Uncharacterized protein n=1 Tax=Synchytrium endobioticum TaxID=286115 RepID=A0A507CM95_9FUNG|nr:hypothetical protein SeLEV6574_g07102 [Synchytrium endobioticum]
MGHTLFHKIEQVVQNMTQEAQEKKLVQQSHQNSKAKWRLWRILQTLSWIAVGFGVTYYLDIIPIIYHEAFVKGSRWCWLWIISQSAFFGIFVWLNYIRPRFYGILFSFDNWRTTAEMPVQIATASAGFAMVSIVVVYWTHFHLWIFLSAIIQCV